MTSNSRAHWVVFGLGMQLIFAGQALAADVYKASAKFTNAEGKRVSTPVTISLEQTTPETERKAMAERVRTSPEAAKGVLAGQKQLGYIEAVERRVPIRYAYVQPGGDGAFIIVISDEALGYIGGDKRSAKPKEGFDLTYAQLTMKASGNGSGEIAPACKVKFMESGAAAVEDYGKQVVWLDDATKVAQP